jgi:predicted metal-dependent phosphoesterase TrpH
MKLIGIENIDLHIHSFFSDGTMSPAEIYAAARDKGLSLIAVTDHNVLEGSRELMRLCGAGGPCCVPAVEIDCLDGGRSIHVLGYGVDLDDGAFVAFIRRNRGRLDRISEILVERMSADYPEVTPGDFARFTYDPRGGGWKALHYLLGKGLSGSLLDGLRYYAVYDCPYSIVDFPSVGEACRTVRAASGLAVLAHPGETLDTADMDSFKAELARFADMGLNGVECYYPTHTGEVTQACAEFCGERGLLATCGSDCHGGFGKTAVGELRVPAGKLSLGGIIG